MSRPVRKLIGEATFGILASGSLDRWQARSTRLPPEAPMITADLLIHGQPLRIFSTLSHFGTALNVSMADLLIKYYFPADEATRLFLQQLAPSDVMKQAD